MTPRFFLAALALALFVFACSLPAKWETVSEGGFSVELPGKPNKQTQTVNTPAGPIAINMFTTETGGEAFIVGYNDFPAQAANIVPAETILNSARDGAIKNVNGKVTSERSINLNGNPGKEFVGDSTTPMEGTFSARIYWVKPRLYQVLYVHRKGTAASENGQKFMNSFKLTGGQ